MAVQHPRIGFLRDPDRCGEVFEPGGEREGIVVGGLFREARVLMLWAQQDRQG